MPARPPYFAQETNYSCAPACLRMVLASFGISKSEKELLDLCDCTALFGTSASNVVEAARKLGFSNTRKYNLDFDSLKELPEQGLFPIAYVKAHLSSSNLSEEHAVVVVEITQTTVIIFDPMRGEIKLPIQDFEIEWNAMRRLTILIE